MARAERRGAVCTLIVSLETHGLERKLQGSRRHKRSQLPKAGPCHPRRTLQPRKRHPRRNPGAHLHERLPKLSERARGRSAPESRRRHTRDTGHRRSVQSVTLRSQPCTTYLRTVWRTPSDAQSGRNVNFVWGSGGVLTKNIFTRQPRRLVLGPDPV